MPRSSRTSILYLTITAFRKTSAADCADDLDFGLAITPINRGKKLRKLSSAYRKVLLVVQQLVHNPGSPGRAGAGTWAVARAG